MATMLDPSITTSDNLSGQVVARKGDLPEVRSSMTIDVKLMDTMVAGEGQAAEKIYPLRNNEMLMINVATATSVGVTKNSEKGKATLDLRLPICADSGQRVSLSRQWLEMASHWTRNNSMSVSNLKVVMVQKSFLMHADGLLLSIQG